MIRNNDLNAGPAKEKQEKLLKALAVVSECMKELNVSNKSYFNGNVSKHRFLNEVQELVKTWPNFKMERESAMLLSTLILHHIENEWAYSETWQEGADRVWNIVQTRAYPRGGF